jgi:hypothetical protein
VREKFDRSRCDDEAGHRAWWACLRAFKNAAAGKGEQSPEAYKILDEAFGPGWRTSSRGTIEKTLILMMRVFCIYWIDGCRCGSSV